jgi:hypothetical protein
MNITRVSEKLEAFRRDFPPRDYAIIQDFDEDIVGSTARVVGHCRIVDVATGVVLAEAHGTRALREPVAGAQGHRDTRDPDRAMTQALGRVLGLMGYADAAGIEGDTDEPDETGVDEAAAPPAPPNPATLAREKLRGLGTFVDTYAPAGSVDTAELKQRLNDLEPMMRGKVRAGLSMAGFPTEIPDRMAGEAFGDLEAFVVKEIDTLASQSPVEPTQAPLDLPPLPSAT